MHAFAWQWGRTEAPLNLLAPPRAASGPNYLALVDVLLNLRQPVNSAGWTNLTPEEAAQIRACGFEANPGEWRCPLMPESAVGTVWRLSHLSTHIRPRPATHVSPVEPLSRFSLRLIRRLQAAPGKCLDRHALKRILWRKPAWFVDFTIDNLLALDQITEQDGLLYPFSRAAFEAWREAQSRPRPQIPSSTF